MESLSLYSLYLLATNILSLILVNVNFSGFIFLSTIIEKASKTANYVKYRVGIPFLIPNFL